MASPDPPPLTVAVIGAGPAGMFFCHALEHHRLELIEKNDETALANLPVVTCFERASGPGGVWRSAPSAGVESSPDETKERDGNMYEALWTNGPKEAIEFFDYTFDDHFGTGLPLPVYMPRRDILDYVIGRVTKRCPEFFEKYMTFDTGVQSVRFVEESKRFEIVTKQRNDGRVTTGYYDKCIWAAGMNGRAMVPLSLKNVFTKGNFPGTTRHSSDTSNFENDVKGKRILLVGGSYSAEDLALVAIKCGVAKVFVSARHANVVNWTGAWPYDRVEVLEDVVPVRVTEDGRCIQFAATEGVEGVLEEDEVGDGDGEVLVQTELRDIDTVIFCTGYSPSLDMLSDELRQAVNKHDTPDELPVPKDWKTSPNELSGVLGDIVPHGDTQVTGCIYPGLYCDSISIQNPGMMFMKFEFENPLFGIDVSSHLLMRYVVGLKQMPSAEEMVKQEQAAALSLTMNNPWNRCMVDNNYFAAVHKNWSTLFPDTPEEEQYELMDQFQSEYEHSLEIRVLTRRMREADYPLSFGSFEELNETAAAYMKFDTLTYDHRARLTETDAENGRTFRDYNVGSDSHDGGGDGLSDGGGEGLSDDGDAEFRSVFTGTLAVPLKQRWLDIDANYSTVLEP